MGTQRHRIDPKEICFCETKKRLVFTLVSKRLRGVTPRF
nr:MAG TPA: hypothetical protein [Caudoviricetes sp.]